MWVEIGRNPGASFAKPQSSPGHPTPKFRADGALARQSASAESATATRPYSAMISSRRSCFCSISEVTIGIGRFEEFGAGGRANRTKGSGLNGTACLLVRVYIDYRVWAWFGRSLCFCWRGTRWRARAFAEAGRTLRRPREIGVRGRDVRGAVWAPLILVACPDVGGVYRSVMCFY